MKIILVGLGHEMHGDDEIGLEVVRRWSAEHPAGLPGMEIRTRILDSPGIDLLGTIAGLDAAILVAALRGGAPLGAVRILKDEQLLDSQGAGRQKSAWGAAETLSLGRRLAPEDLPGELILVGIEGAAFGLGEGLSPAVRAAIPEALMAVDRAARELAGKGGSIKGRWAGLLNRLRRKAGGP